jgi:3-polyprenyl-4-hydroxybenzoate decarboxylase
LPVHATSEIASGSKLRFDAAKKLPGKGFKRSRPPLIRMDDQVKKKVDEVLRLWQAPIIRNQNRNP